MLPDELELLLDAMLFTDICRGSDCWRSDDRRLPVALNGGCCEILSLGSVLLYGGGLM